MRKKKAEPKSERSGSVIGGPTPPAKYEPSTGHSNDKPKPSPEPIKYIMGDGSDGFTYVIERGPVPQAILDLLRDHKMTPAEMDCYNGWLIKNHMSNLGKRGGPIGGKSTSEAKKKASRRNGALGGRPRGSATKERKS